MPTTPSPNDWRGALAELGCARRAARAADRGRDRGSAPREAGAKMVVTIQGQFGSIGGGHLEFKALAQARALIAAGVGSTKLQEYALGPQLGQCCGGRVTLLFECFAGRPSPWRCSAPGMSGARWSTSSPASTAAWCGSTRAPTPSRRWCRPASSPSSPSSRRTRSPTCRKAASRLS
jgi:hypothetical protein